jgi:hypothetical protein
MRYREALKETDHKKAEKMYLIFTIQDLFKGERSIELASPRGAYLPAE